MKKLIPGVLERLDPNPLSEPVPVVFDSPHSGNIYPADFNHALPELVIRRTEDAFVDELYSDAPQFGATLLHALFPRCYIDPNRRANDIDENLLTAPWPADAKPGPKVKLGIGLIRSIAVNEAIYDRQLSVAEVQNRLHAYYYPYHQELANTLTTKHQCFGAVWHINCHSMRSRSGAVSPEGPAKQRNFDFCLGDRDGRSCEPEFTELVAATLRGLGYKVWVNKPYKGVELVSRYSDPSEQRHSLQIEINRSLYMNEYHIERSTDFAEFKVHIGQLVKAICEYAREQSKHHGIYANG